MSDRIRLAVLGSPIAHSKSPPIHRAAYRELGLPWTYEAIRVDETELAPFLAGLDARWRGLSLTMPLKRTLLPHLATRSPTVDLVGGANTVRIDEEGLHGTNTDIAGIVAALRGGGVDTVRRAVVLGAGATAASVLAALAELGMPAVTIVARTPSKAEGLRPLARRLGIELSIASLADGVTGDPDLLVSTLPATAPVPEVPERIRRAATLFDVAYDPWPSVLARAWGTGGGPVVAGIEMLLHQAVGQIRFFLTGDETRPLSHEQAVLERMRTAVADGA